MGRYYSGDIEGKFWFSVQSSYAADRFGVDGEPAYINYRFKEENLDDVNEEIENIINDLGDKKERLDKFFEEKDSYSDSDLQALNVTKDDLSDYADLLLGIQIRDYIVENGECNFEAEL